MSGTQAVAVKRVIVEALQPVLGDVEVRYGPGGQTPRELVYFGKATSESELTTFRPGGGKRIPRKEDLRISLHIRVDNPGDGDEAAEARACEIGELIEDYLAANPTLGRTDNTLLVWVSDMELETGADDAGSFARLAYVLAVTAVLS